MAFVIKAKIAETEVKPIAFTAQKTMYGGKAIAAGDIIFLFASEHEGGKGLVARGLVVEVRTVAKRPSVARQTTRIDLSIEVTARARRALGRAEVRGFSDWNDGQPQTELNFKLYRQATNKVVGISDATAAYLDGFFDRIA